MQLFVTGATGFIGRHFVRQALARGHRVRALCRPTAAPRSGPLQAGVEWIEKPLDADLSGCFGSVDRVVHLASHTPNPPYAPLAECLYWNVFASIQLAQCAMDAGVSDFIVAGTYFEYGTAARGMETIHPGTPLQPLLSYPISKAAASVAFTGLAREKGLKLQLLRIFQVYGEGEGEKRFWPSLRRAAFAGEDFPMSAGTQVRDFIEAGEVASAFLEAAEAEGVEAGKPQQRNVGTGRARTLLDFASEWWERWGATGKLLPGVLPARAGEMPRLVANIAEVQIG
jgi:nucleoside-diphosphate-sugar epimerase